jgi:uncharacterized protein
VEECTIKNMGNAFHIHAVINGSHNSKNFSARYHIVTNANWQTLTAAVGITIADDTKELLEGDGDGSWQLDGQPAPQLEGCIDIDIPLTPFTNTLPINRLKMQDGEQQKIKVVYLDLLEDSMSMVQQLYKKLPGSKYNYQNIPNDFEANIEVDEDGLVKDYPGLFHRV